MLHMPKPLLVLFAVAYAGTFASFTAVVIDRVPTHRPLHGTSRCVCGQPVRWRHNIPGVSWLMLRGRAACCGAPIPVWLWVLEASTMVLVGTTAWWSPAVAAAIGLVWLTATAQVGIARRRRARVPLQR